MKQIRDSASEIDMFDGRTPGERIARAIDRIRSKKTDAHLLVALLPQQHKIYAGRGANQIFKLRGYILASFQETGLPPAALPYVLEELENSQNAYVTAAAARAIRGTATRDAGLVPFLITGIVNTGHHDDAIDLETFRPEYPLKAYSTAISELILSLKWLGFHARAAVPFLRDMAAGKLGPVDKKRLEELYETILAIEGSEAGIEDCCEDRFRSGKLGQSLNRLEKLEIVRKIELEDQDNNIVSFENFFHGTISVIGFFYTRCDNPNKCSLTITKIAQLQERLRELGLDNSVNIAAITYDSGYDRPERLKGYCLDRGFASRENHRSFRLVERDNFVHLSEYLGLGVNFAGSIVNHHRIELFVLDRTGKVAREYTQLRWNVTEVGAAIAEMASERPSIARKTLDQTANYFSSLMAGLLPIVIAFFPKCPVCWAGYASVLAMIGVSPLPYSPWLLSVFVLMAILNLGFLIHRARKRNFYLPIVFSLSGLILMMILGSLLGYRSASIAGTLLVLAGSLLNSLSMSQYGKRLRFSRSIDADLKSIDVTSLAVELKN